MRLYHGSETIIEAPVYGGGKQHNDYGRGFYCTEHLELAKEWACTQRCSGFVNCYDIDLSDMRILNLSDGEYSVLHWLTVLISYRTFDISAPVVLSGMEYLKKNYMVNVEAYDIIRGYRADDSYFSFAKAFLNNTITLDQLSRAMRLGMLGEQIVLKSKEAFKKLKYVSFIPAEADIYYAKRKSRDEKARMDYREMSRKLDKEGVYLIDIIRGER